MFVSFTDWSQLAQSFEWSKLARSKWIYFWYTKIYTVPSVGILVSLYYSLFVTLTLSQTCLNNFLNNFKKCTRSEVRTHAGIPPLELKSNALTTRPSWLCASVYFFDRTQFDLLELFFGIQRGNRIFALNHVIRNLK